MGGICGWTASGGDAAGANALLHRMAGALSRLDETAVRVACGGTAGAAVAGRSASVRIAARGNRLAAIWGNATSARTAASGTEGLAGALLDRWTGAAPDLADVTGHFVVALCDGDRGEAFVAVDRMGTRPVFFHAGDGGFVFGSNIDAVRRHPAVRSEIDPQGVYNYAYFHMIPGPGTVFRGIRRLLPGEYAAFRNGKVEVGTWWAPKYVENATESFPTLQGQFVAAMRDAVGRAAEGAKTGCFLSGGTDSSTVAGMLGRVTGSPAQTYSIGFDATGYDEMEYARIAARHFGTQHHEYYVTPADIVDAIPRIAAAYDQPFGNSSAVPTYYCAKLARGDGIERMLGGDGGDELFGGNTRYAKQRVFSFYEQVPGPLRGVVEAIAYGIPGGGAIMPVRKARSYIEQAKIPMPARTETYNLLERMGPQNVFVPEFLAQCDRGVPLALIESVYGSANAGTQLNRMLALDRVFTLADNDLPKVSRMCELAGVEVAYPILDDAVVAFSLTLHPDLKLKGSKLRYFFKEALRDFLPPEIITKQKHGFGLPFGPWLVTHKPLRDLTYGCLERLKGRGMVKPQLIDELLSERITDHADYFGTMAWILMMLEQWLKAHVDTAAQTVA